jgi:hypothetical protein
MDLPPSRFALWWTGPPSPRLWWTGSVPTRRQTLITRHWELITVLNGLPNGGLLPRYGGMRRWPIVSPGMVSKIPLCVLLIALLGLCSCATESPVHSGLPADVTMNSGAGRGDWLIVPVQLGDGKKLPFILDTGAATTVFDESLVPKLGDPITLARVSYANRVHRVPVYYVPPMYLGNTRLQTGVHVITHDFSRTLIQGGYPVKGVLGMDVLTHYCIQLDFKKRKVRFLNDTMPDTNWGRPFPLLDSGNGCFWIRPNLVGTEKFGSLIDTGDNRDGWLRPELFEEWTNQAVVPLDINMRAPNGVLAGDMFLNLNLRERPLQTNDFLTWFNGIGLRALAHGVVTLDFPRQTMYLQHVDERSRF